MARDMSIRELAEATVGDRVYAIRLSLGDGWRTPGSLRDFAARIAEITGQKVDPSGLSLIERDMQALTLEQAVWIAAADPLHRGACWVAFGNAPVKPRRRKPEATAAAPRVALEEEV